MSSAPTSLPSSAASSEAFAQPSSIHHGVSDHLSSGLFQPLLLERESEDYLETNGRREGKREKQRRKKGGSLNPLAEEFVPGEAPISGTIPRTTSHTKFEEAGGRDKVSSNGNSWRPRGGHDGMHRHSVIFRENVKKGNSGYGSVIFREDVKKGNSGYGDSAGSLQGLGGGLSTALRKGARTDQLALQENSSSSVRIPGGQASGSSAQGSVAGTTIRKGQGFNGNHLLNFQYDPVPRPPPRAPPIRRARKSQPYNKELFLQANFRFLVSDFGDYMLNTSDPDKMLQWEDVAAVNFAAPVPVYCPICLDRPLCPQITTCGHMFCFPCILRYLLMGVLEIRGEHWKKCPLCFAMICSKELRTVLIDDVHQHSVGDIVKFTLLMRAKGSIIPFERAGLAHGPLAYSRDGQCHPFSKFTLTSDAEPTATKAISELTSWAERVQLEGGEDEELLPFVFVAVEQLRQRKDAWTEHRAMAFLSSSTPVRQRIMAQTKSGIAKVPANSPLRVSQKSCSVDGREDADGLSSLIRTASQEKLDTEKMDVVAETEAAMADLKERAGWVYENAFSDDEDGQGSMLKIKGLSGSVVTSKVVGKAKSFVNLVSEKPDSWEEATVEVNTEDSTVTEEVEKKDQDTKKELEERESYTYYQSADGQILILHPLNMKCLLHYYGSYEALPTSLEAKLVEMEMVTQTDLTRKRYRYLSHLPLTAMFQLCEVDLSNLLPDTSFIPFAEEIRSREGRRRRILKQDKEKQALEERTAALEVARYNPPTEADFAAALTALQIDEGLTGLDVEVSDQLGVSPVVAMSPPEYEERKLFSSVAKLGFASGYDAPDLISSRPAVETSSSLSPTYSSAWVPSGASSSETGTSRGHISFAGIIAAQATRADNEEGPMVGHKVGVKKGKKASKVILSTAGGRRY